MTTNIHVGIIMDGNGRFATSRNKPRAWGHRQGGETLRRIVNHCPKLGVDVLTVYAFSTENWKRAPAEIKALFALLHDFFTGQYHDLIRHNVRVYFLGRRDRLPEHVLRIMNRIEETTQHATGLLLRVAIDYGGRHAIVQGVKNLVRNVCEQRLSVDHITEGDLAHAMGSTCKDPDLIIRTGGEQRLSNFLLMESAYSELFFVKTLWPEFTPHHFQDIVNQFHARCRLFGGGR